MAERLEGKGAIVTGAATGMGKAIAHPFALLGAQEWINRLPKVWPGRERGSLDAA